MAPTIEDIVEILGNMRIEDAKNTDVLRIYFTELKKSLDEKNSFTSDKFEDLKQSFDGLIASQADISKTEELKSLFEVFQKHVNIIAEDMLEQQNILNSIDKTLQNLDNQKMEKSEFIENFELIKDTMYTSISKLDANDEYAKLSMENITERLNSLATQEDSIDLKLSVELLVQKSNDTVDALKFFNDKSEKLATAIQNMITNEDYTVYREKIDTILKKGFEIENKVSLIPIKLDEISNIYSEKAEAVLENLANYMNNLSTTLFQEDSNKFSELQMSLVSISDSFNENIDMFKGKMSEFINSISNITDENKQKIDTSITELSDIKTELTEIDNVMISISPKIDAKSDEIVSLIHENITALTSELDIIKDNVGNCIHTTSLQDCLDSFVYRFDEIGKYFYELKEDVNNADKNIISDVEEKLNGLRQEINLVNTDIVDVTVKKNEEVIQLIISLKQDLTELLAFDFSKNFEEIKAQIEMSYLNVGSDINMAFSQNQDSITQLEHIYKELYSSIMSLDEYTKNNIQNNLDLLKLSIEGLEKNIDNKFSKTYDFIDNWDNELEKIRSFTEGIKSDLTFKIEECCNNLKSSDDKYTEQTIGEIQNLKGSIDENFSKVADNFASVIEIQKDKTQEREIIKDEVTTLGETLKDFVTFACESSLKKVDETIHNINAIGTMVDNNDEIVSVIDNIKNVLTKEIMDKLSDYTTEQDAKLEKIKADINSYVYTEQIEEEKAKILDKIFDVKSKSDNNQQIMNIIENLEKRINSINAKNPVNDYVKSLSEVNKKAIFEELTKIKNELEFCVAESQDSLNKLTENVSDVADNIVNLDDKVFDINKLLLNVQENLNNSVETSKNGYEEVSDKLDSLSTSDTHLIKTLEALHSKVDILALDDTDDNFDIAAEIDEIKDLIKNQIEELKNSEQNSNNKYMDECFNKLLEDMNSIRDDVPNKEVKESVISAIVSIFEQVSFVEETEEIKDFVEEKTDKINEKLKEVHEQLQLITSGENSDYTYSLQDVESDIAKLRLAMREVTNSAPQQTLIELRDHIEQVVTSVENMQSSLTNDEIVGLKNDFTKLSEDMVSISSRTNKLLLTSDESYKALSDGLDRFGGLIYKLEDKIQFPDTTEIDERIEKKVDALSVVVNNSVANDEIFHQVLQYLGEWMDSVSESINSISEKTSEISKIKDITEELKFLMPQKSDLIEELEHRFEAQELRIDRLEMKLDNILLAIEEKSDSLISKKMDKLEKQIVKLGMNVEKLASYVDEE